MSDFATPTPIIQAAFDRIEKGAKFGFWRAGAVYAAFKSAHQAGTDEREAVVKALAGKKWAWPWFDQLVVAFQQVGFWPATWHDMKIAPPPPWAAIPEEMRSSLFALTLVAAVYVTRDINNLAESAKVTGWKLTLVPGNDACPAETYFADLHRRAVERGNYSNLPPFFPGDGTQVRIHDGKRHPRRRPSGT